MITSLGTHLGRLAAPPSTRPYDAIRLDMVDRLLTTRPVNPGHEPWALAWHQAAVDLCDAVLGDARDRLRDAARRSRYPSKQLAALEPDAEAADILLNRLLAEGMALEQFERQASDAETERRRGAALESAWMAATQMASTEAARWRAAATRLAQWRRPMTVVWIGGAVALAAAAVVAAWLGGHLAAPEWFAPMHRAWWSLPWP